MSTDVISSRYRLTEVVARTGETTTWAAHDTWLDQPVMLVTPQPGATARFEEMAASLREHVSQYLVALYDSGPPPTRFVVLEAPSATLFDELATMDEEDAMAAGRSLGDALDALHRRDIIHGGIKPGTVVRAEDGQIALSPWPLAPEPPGWNGPRAFHGDPPERDGDAVAGDIRAIGALLLGALGGPHRLSSERMENLERKLASHAPGAPSALGVAQRALRPVGQGGYLTAGELRDDCVVRLSGEATVGEASAGEQSARRTTTAAPPARAERPVQASRVLNRHAGQNDAIKPERPEGGRMAVAVTLAVALVAGASATGALSGSTPRHHDVAVPKPCSPHRTCGGAPDGANQQSVAAAPTTPRSVDSATAAVGAAAASHRPATPTATFADLPASGGRATATTPPTAEPATRPAIATSTPTTPSTPTTSPSSTTSSTTTTLPPGTTTTTLPPSATTTSTTSTSPSTSTTTTRPSGQPADGPGAAGPSTPAKGG